MRCIFLIAFLGLAVAACDTAIDPFDRDGLQFSIQGYLDAQADTQYVRVTPLRDSLALNLFESPDYTVELHHEVDGRTVRMQDSLFRFVGGRFAYNWWASGELEHGRGYRLTVQGADGATSSVRVQIPESIPEMELIIPRDPFTPLRFLTQAIKIRKVEKLAALQLKYRVVFPPQVEAEPQIVNMSILQRVGPIGPDLGIAFFPYKDLMARFDGACPLVLSTEVILAASTDDWPDLEGIDPETLARPDVISNVENGVGFLGGLSITREDWGELTQLAQGLQFQCERGTYF
ncbi:MAG: hypothetical protein JJ896_13995 [Rhodothermales bacterium]|nr:hypothetical protein [Rhodothermales bacterium]MBO6780762.1 hypothetical protein [Rhodothermales bacterium]